jgi:hypothetical protein
MTARAERRPVFLFDGDCAFCTSCARLLKRIGPKAEIAAWQISDLDELGVTAAQAEQAVRWIEPDGTVRSGHEAIAAALGTAGVHPGGSSAARCCSRESRCWQQRSTGWSPAIASGCPEVRPPARPS